MSGMRVELTERVGVPIRCDRDEEKKHCRMSGELNSWSGAWWNRSHSTLSTFNSQLHDKPRGEENRRARQAEFCQKVHHSRRTLNPCSTLSTETLSAEAPYPRRVTLTRFHSGLTRLARTL